MKYFIYNGKFHQQGSAIIRADNRGLRFGDGVFETMTMTNGDILFEDEHFSRLWKSMKILEFELPKHFTVEQLQNEIKNLAKKNQHTNHARIRLTIVRGDGGLYDALNHFPNYIIETWPLTQDTGQWNSNGLVLGIYEGTKKSCDILSNLKHNNYLPNVLAALAAKKLKWNDAILLNANGRICETTIGNIFIVKDGVIYTPSLSEGCIAGIMRRAVIKNLQSDNLSMFEKHINTEDLINADEVFVTNSVYKLRWVKSIGERTYHNAVSQKIFASLSKTILKL
ncbi:MAG: aminodeoxychorismate lyase [Ferruginibacter sp.]